MTLYLQKRSQLSVKTVAFLIRMNCFCMLTVAKQKATLRKYFFLKFCFFLCSFSWTRAFLRRSAWCLGTRKVSWLWPTRTWSAALTVPSRSCRPLHPALCSAAFRPGRVELPGPGAHFCTTVEDQAQRDDISMAKAAGQGFVNLSHIHWPCPPGRLF